MNDIFNILLFLGSCSLFSFLVYLRVRKNTKLSEKRLKVHQMRMEILRVSGHRVLDDMASFEEMVEQLKN